MTAFTGLVSDPITAEPQAPARSGLVLAVRKVDGAEFDRIVSGFDGVCKEQLYRFAAVRWPGVVLEPRLFELERRVVGGVLMMVQKLPLGLARIAIAKWGPMLADSGSSRASETYQGMIEALVTEYADKRGMMISLLPHASVKAQNGQYRALLARGFRPGAALPYPDRYLVNLRLSDPDQRASFDQTWRRQLKRAEKAGLVFERAGADRLGEFKALYATMTDRKQFRDHSAFETIDSLMELDEPARPELFFVRHEEQLVAGAVIFKAGERAAYLYGATNDQALPLRAGYFLHWQVIRWLRDHARAGWYDLGGTDGYSGLHQFKKGMVGDQGVIRPLPPVLNYARSPLAFWLGATALGARELLNDIRRKIDARHPSGVRPDLAPTILDNSSL
ncbi:lipid II:glycine glycyltransferase FemX [Devosia rhizoryzae]|uniref:Peptidoglycan bridge formation glycyltransferase FemA/FemB family protein n=1 Tax=Devosia rhizoryzae TaxID=2774137 RepID=A0ABX7CCA6_9HYPH|nr:peptidoglycan bridge formation glycyltransferase FemA/FemB family protein [Devosia rhizoryzae]QQR40240.1 peptidoglycan bridge formation glycyltransferase FemA/FemB family protein [Devosia rhizoryzae]